MSLLLNEATSVQSNLSFDISITEPLGWSPFINVSLISEMVDS